jgi:hypothetical protein
MRQLAGTTSLCGPSKSLKNNRILPDFGLKTGHFGLFLA